MKAARPILVLAAILAAASVAQADMARFPAVPVAVPAVGIISPATPCPDHDDSRVDEPAVGAADDLSVSSLLTGRPWYEGSLPLVPAAAAPKTEIRELPGLPSSSSLFLSAVLSVGAWHVVRKAGQAHWAHLPEWYHPDAPHQIGQSVAFDPTLGFELLAVCVFDAPPTAAELAPIPDTPREIPSRCESQHFLSVEAPRGPPSLS